MHKNDRFTFEAYSDQAWWATPARARAYTYVPDEIFAPVLATLQTHAPHILKFSDTLVIDRLKAGSGRSWAWSETLATVQAVWQSIDAGYGDFITQLIDDAVFRRTDVKEGQGDGQCFYDFAEIDSDGTLNDPVCAVHESGHLMAFMKAPDQDHNEPAQNIKEIQAIFAQEHGYEYLLQQTQNDSEHMAVRRHRMTYYLGVLSHIPLYLDMINCTKTGQSQLKESFDRWSVDYRMAGHLVNDRNGERKGPQRLHTHPFATMLAPAFYQRFRAKPPEERQNILKVLYEGGPETTLVDVLAAFDIHTPDDVRVAAEETCRNFKAEIRLLVPKAALPDMAL